MPNKLSESFQRRFSAVLPNRSSCRSSDVENPSFAIFAGDEQVFRLSRIRCVYREVAESDVVESRRSGERVMNRHVLILVGFMISASQRNKIIKAYNSIDSDSRSTDDGEFGTIRVPSHDISLYEE